jgi:hypothetical protein
MTNKKALFVLLLVCALVPLTANATVTRVIGLGGDGTNYIVRDPFNASVWPQLIADHPNLAGGEFYTGNRGWDFQKAYVNYSFPTKCVLQFALDRMPGLTSSFGQTYPLVPASLDTLGGGSSFANKFSVIYGRPLGDMMKIGLGLSYSGRSASLAAVDSVFKPDTSMYYYPPNGRSYIDRIRFRNWHNNDIESSASLLGLNFGVSALDNKLDVSLGYEMAGFDDKGGAMNPWPQRSSMTP